MTLRICPNCKEILNLSDHYFCSKCGAVLDQSTLNPLVPLKVRTQELKIRNFFWTDIVDKLELQNRLEKVHRKPVVEALLFVVLLAGMVILYNALLVKYVLNIFNPLFTVSTQEDSKNSSLSSALGGDEKTILRTSLGMPQVKFTDLDFTRFAPYETIFYVELSSAASFGNVFFSSDPLFQYFMNTQEYFYPQGALFVTNTSSGYLLTPKYLDKAKEWVQDAPTDFVKPYLVGDKVLITSDPSLVELVTNSSKNLVKNMEKQPSYALTVPKLPKSGSARVLVLHIQNVENSKLLNVPETTSVPVNTLLDEIVKRGYNGYVIN